jgi:hypothetical protein
MIIFLQQTPQIRIHGGSLATGLQFGVHYCNDSLEINWKLSGARALYIALEGTFLTKYLPIASKRDLT